MRIADHWSLLANGENRTALFRALNNDLQAGRNDLDQTVYALNSRDRRKADNCLNGPVAIDPTAPLAAPNGSGFDASFSPYQYTRLSRYNAVS